MSLEDFGLCEGEVNFSNRISEEDLEKDFKSFVVNDAMRRGKQYSWGNWSFWRDKGLPIMKEMGFEFGARQITPALERWP